VKGKWGSYWHYATAGGVPKRSAMVALVVGTILNLINQGDALFGHGRINWLKIALTFIVPYCVATYGAATALARGSKEPDPS